MLLEQKSKMQYNFYFFDLWIQDYVIWLCFYLMVFIVTAVNIDSLI